MMNDNYRSGNLIVKNHVLNMQASPTDHVLSVYKHETSRYKEPFFVFSTEKHFHWLIKSLSNDSGVGSFN